MVDVALLDRAAAADAALIAAVRAVVNAAYDRGEAGLWLPGSERVSAGELRTMTEAGELAAARAEGEVAGSVRITSIDARLAELGLLAVAPERSGAGIGRALMDFAHDLARARGHTTMRLTLLVPREGNHAFKDRLHAWYSRQGYRVVAREDFAVTHPHLTTQLLVPCDLLVFERALG